MSYTTEQEMFWAGNFGDEYTKRNNTPFLKAGNVSLFSKALAHKPAPETIVEFGANRGLNIQALKILFPKAKFLAVEINAEAVSELKKLSDVDVFHGSIFDYNIKSQADLALIKGVLIHINPDYLIDVYKKLYESSKKYILIAEYYNPSPVAINYRGHSDKLFKRDFAGEMLDAYSDLKLIDYGFCYHRDAAFPMDDITWFLLEKKGA